MWGNKSPKPAQKTKSFYSRIARGKTWRLQRDAAGAMPELLEQCTSRWGRWGGDFQVSGDEKQEGPVYLGRAMLVPGSRACRGPVVPKTSEGGPKKHEALGAAYEHGTRVINIARTEPKNLKSKGTREKI